MTSLSAPLLYPTPSAPALKLQFVGKLLSDVQAPAAVLDVAAIRRNCTLMLETAKRLGVGFRAHVKTHKTTELTRLQVGEGAACVRLVVSTIAEAENLVPYLLECCAKGRKVNVLYGMPVTPSHVTRLAAITRLVGEGSIGLFVDHPEQVKFLSRVGDVEWIGRIPVFVKIDAGYHRAGLSPQSKTLDLLASTVAGQQKVRVAGAYSHMGNSYASASPEEALGWLRAEIEEVRVGAERLAKSLPEQMERLTISVGATPTASAAQNILDDDHASVEYRNFIARVQETFDVELHAGVYPVLDMQQLATRARPARFGQQPGLSFDNLALRIMVEVASVYDERQQPEALIGAGSIVLGREPCKSYDGWGVVTPWTSKGGTASMPMYDPEGSKTGWIVGRISQEHGMLTWEGSQDSMRKLELGEKVMIWPNHACMSGPSFGWYLVVDSDGPDPNRVVDVWVRWRGW